VAIFRRRTARTAAAAETADPDAGPAPGTGLATAVADRAGARLPADIVAVMEGFGRWTFDPADPRNAGVEPWESFIAGLWPYAREDPEGFAAALAERILPTGGWAAYGAAHAVVELTDRSGDNPAQQALMDASLRFLRRNGVPMTQLTRYEKAHWNHREGAFESWLAPRVPPRPAAAPITALVPREVRRVVQLEDRADATVYCVQLGTDGRHLALVDARWGDGDRRRVRSVWTAEATLHDLYLEIGWSLQVPPYWHHPELTPYIPYSRPLI
jgi:hypothetical protein